MQLEERVATRGSGARETADREGPGTLTPTARTLSEALAEVLDVADVPHDGHFFDDLGADSLVVAELCARLRNTPDVPRLSIKDVYQHPTLAGLARHLDLLAVAEAGEAHDNESEAFVEIPTPEPSGDGRPTTTAGYWLFGFLQLATLVGFAALAALIAELAFELIAPASGVRDTYLRSVAVGGALFVLLTIVPIASKWVIIGRWKPKRIRLWSLGHFRFWLGRIVTRANPMVLFAGTPIYPLYLRALGAKIGRGTMILTRRVPVCTDLLTVGSGAVVREGTSMSCYRAHGRHLELGSVEVGADAVVGHGTVLDIWTRVGRSAQIGHSSALSPGQSVPDGARMVGTPATSRVEFDFADVPAASRPTTRRLAYGLFQFTLLFLVTAPIITALMTWFLEWRTVSPPTGTRISVLDLSVSPQRILVATAALFVGLLVLRLLLAIGVGRLLARFVRADAVYPLFGIRYLAHRGIQRLTNIAFFTQLFGDSSYVVHYCKALGYDVSFEEQTGANFGQTIRHDNPNLVSIGQGTMAADGLTMVNTDYSATSFRLGRVEIGAHNFLGNQVSYPSQGATGENCLLASKVMVPIEGAERENAGFLGSPCFEIPRTVFRDREFESLRRSDDFPKLLSAKNRHNVATMGWLLLVRFVALLGAVGVAFGIADLFGRFGAGAAFVGLLVLGLIGPLYLVLVERASIRFRGLRPLHCSIYDADSWRIERYWKLSWNPRILNGTPFKAFAWRLLGVRVGRRLFDDGATITEKTMVTIGDDCVLNAQSAIQPHSQEDGSFKSDFVEVGSGCTLGVSSLVHYGVTMGDRSSLEANSFLMKGTAVPIGTNWGENPARELDTVPSGGGESHDVPGLVSEHTAVVDTAGGANGSRSANRSGNGDANGNGNGTGSRPIWTGRRKDEIMRTVVTTKRGSNGSNGSNGAAKSNGGPDDVPQTADEPIAAETTAERATADQATSDGYWRDALLSGGFTPIPRWTCDDTDTESETNVALAGDLVAELEAFAQRNDTTVSALLLAAHARVIASLTGEEDVVVGFVPDAAASALPCRLTVADGSWNDMVAEARSRVRDTTLHRDVDLAALRSELNLPGPPFETAVDGSAELASLPADAALVVSIQRGVGGSRLRVNFRTSEFDADTANRIAGYHLRALEQLRDDPSARLRRQSLLSPEEVDHQIHGLAGPARELPDRRFHELFEERVVAHPDAVAARHLGDRWTYRELNERANQVARALVERGVGSETVVAVVTERNLAWMAAVIGTFKAGGVYLPIEPHFPPGRIEKTLDRAGCELVLTETGSTTTLDEALAALGGRSKLLLGDVFDQGGATDNLDVEVEPGQLAYIYFTSGSTGEPKGAMCEHVGMLNHLYAKIDDLGVGEGEVVAQIAPQCFDISLWQLVSSLLVGGSTLIVDQDTIMQPERFIDLIVESEVGVMQVVPSYLEVLLTYLDQHPRELGVLHCVSVTGEALTLELAQRWFGSQTGIELVNAYGLTETSDDTNHEVMAEAPVGFVPLGPAVSNVFIYVVDEHLSPVPLGAPGEITFSGICVGRGYINDPERTAQAYLDDPIRPGERLYRSGDFGRWRPDGKLEYLGRRDAQVKIRGFRIEIGEIENALAQTDGIRQAAVVITERDDGNKQLVAFYAGNERSVDELREQLGRSLPEYMVPSAFHWQETLPLTDNGKLNRKALRALAEDMESGAVEFEALGTPTEARLAAVWADVLGVPVEQIGRQDHFFDRGGSSLSAVELVVSLDNTITLKDVTGAPVLADLARVLDGDTIVEGRLLQRLSEPAAGNAGTLVCLPYAGGNAVNFQSLARALRDSELAVVAVELPGHQLAEDDDDFASFDEIAERVVAEIGELGDGPIALWGHSAGSALAVEVARRLDTTSYDLRTVFVAAQLPGDVSTRRAHLDELCATSDRKLVASLTSDTGYGDLGGLDAVQIGHLGAALRHDVVATNRFFIERLEGDAEPLDVPIVVVATKDDPATADAAERYTEWKRFGDRVELRELEVGGHFFIRNEPELAARIVRQHLLGEIAEPDEPTEPATRPPRSARSTSSVYSSTIEVWAQDGRPPLVAVEDDPYPIAWAAAHRETLRSEVTRHGALLVRGLTFEGPDDVLAVAQILANGLVDDVEAFAPRERRIGQVYSSSAWPANQQMCMHHELSYRQTVPGLMMLGCLQEPTSGGAIPLAHSSQVLEVLPPDLVGRFEEQGWILSRNYTEDIGLSVAEAFGTDDRDAIDHYCGENSIDFEWLPDGGLRTRQKRRAVVTHPENGRRGWFNQIAFLNEWTLKPEVREFLLDMYGAGGLPFTTLFGDGEPIGPDVVTTINEAYDSCTIREPLRTNDLYLVDNIATAHSREPFEGDREVVVALGDPRLRDVQPTARRTRRKATAGRR